MIYSDLKKLKNPSIPNYFRDIRDLGRRCSIFENLFSFIYMSFCLKNYTCWKSTISNNLAQSDFSDLMYNTTSDFRKAGQYLSKTTFFINSGKYKITKISNLISDKKYKCKLQGAFLIVLGPRPKKILHDHTAETSFILYPRRVGFILNVAKYGGAAFSF